MSISADIRHQSNAYSSTAPLSFKLPPELTAGEPAERRGIARDEVRLMVINRASYEIEHTHFYSLGKFLEPGDLLVFNSSRTIPASLIGYKIPVREGIVVEVRLAERLSDDSWLALILPRDGDGKAIGSYDLCPDGPLNGVKVEFGHGLVAKVYDRDKNIPTLWKIRFSQSGIRFMESLYLLGQPVRYEYVSKPWDLDYYQTVYAKEPGSVEMPSAGRSFTWKLLLGLKRQGIEMAFVTLHTGLSSYVDDTVSPQHLVSEEEYFVNNTTSEKINKTHSQGGRVIAIGTTAVRTLESAADNDGTVHAGHKYTRLHITANYNLKTVDGLLTGLHEPEASHLDLLAAFLPTDKIHQAYEQAIRRSYLWHEFGDLNLIL